LRKKLAPTAGMDPRTEPDIGVGFKHQHARELTQRDASASWLLDSRAF
jgi:hypothetical protein